LLSYSVQISGLRSERQDLLKQFTTTEAIAVLSERELEKTRARYIELLKLQSETAEKRDKINKLRNNNKTILNDIQRDSQIKFTLEAAKKKHREL
jgi:hypothetical protein